MAQIGVQQPTNLMEMFSSGSTMLGDIAAGQVNDQRIGNYLNQQQALQDMFYAEQDRPEAMRGKRLSNDTLEAQLGGHRASSSLLEDKASVSRQSLPMQHRAALSDLASKISNNDLLEAENAIKTAQVHPSAKVREAANMMWENMSHIKELKLKHDQKMSEIGATGSNQANVMQMQIDAGRFRDKNAAIGFWGSFGKLKNARDKHAALILEARKEEQEGNITGASQLRQMAEDIRPQAEAEIGRLQQQPGTPDIAAITQGKVPTAPAQSIAPGGTSNQPSKQTPTPKSQQEYDALPSGTIYIDTDGKTKRKK